VLSLKSTHQVADLMELVAHKISIDVHSAAQDATNQILKVLGSLYNIDNRHASDFLTVTGAQAQLKSDKLAERTESLSFFRFSYSLDPSTIDSRIIQKPSFFSCCLCLPQRRYCKKENRI